MEPGLLRMPPPPFRYATRVRSEAARPLLTRKAGEGDHPKDGGEGVYAGSLNQRIGVRAALSTGPRPGRRRRGRRPGSRGRPRTLPWPPGMSRTAGRLRAEAGDHVRASLEAQRLAGGEAGAEVGGARGEVAMVQVVGLDPGLDEGPHQRLQRTRIVVDPSQQHGLAEQWQAGVGEAVAGGAGRGGQLARMVGVHSATCRRSSRASAWRHFEARR